MDLLRGIALRNFVLDRELLVGGTITFWDTMFPNSPIQAEILGMEEVYYKGCDYRDFVVYTSDFLPVSGKANAPMPRWRHFWFMGDSPTTSISDACRGMWVVAIPGVGVAHLKYHSLSEIPEAATEEIVPTEVPKDWECFNWDRDHRMHCGSMRCPLKGKCTDEVP